MAKKQETYDLLVIGGGVNGAGIARDASGRGLSVLLCEQGDLASATSSASTKLFHGGLRYLEQYEFLLVRKALIEREVLLRNMPHIAQPMRFILPHAKGMRPAWLLRLGLFLYDSLGGRKLLAPTKPLDLRKDIAGRALKPELRRAFEYSDGSVDDARLVVLNARDAADRGAVIQTRMRVLSAKRDKGVWICELQDQNNKNKRKINVTAVVNAGGPWVNRVIENVFDHKISDPIRLVRGSHIVTPRLYAHNRAYFFQNADGRIIFAIPYQEDFTMIGTTDVDHRGDPAMAECTDAEKKYLCTAASEYFANPIKELDVVWSFAGVRPLDDALEGSASKASRDYHIQLEDQAGVLPLINVFGGKITTYRKLAEEVVASFAPYLPMQGHPWTDHTPLPGGDFEFDGRPALVAKLQKDYPDLEPRTARRLVASYGTLAWKVLGQPGESGKDFGAGISEAELRWLIEREWAETAEDIIWRRTKCGLRMSDAEIAALEDWLAENRQ